MKKVTSFDYQSSAELEFSDMLAQAKEALNELALQRYDEAPFIQWAVVSLSRYISGNIAQTEEREAYLEMTDRALAFSNQLSQGALGRTGDNRTRRSLLNAVVHIEHAVRQCRDQNLKDELEKSIEAQTHVTMAALECLAAKEYSASSDT